MIYVFLVIILFLCLFIRKGMGKTKRSDLWFVFVFFGTCALIMGLRALTVGQDTHHYHDAYNFVKQYPFAQLLEVSSMTGIEVGYVFLMKLSDVIFGEYLFFQLAVSFIICFSYGKFLLNEEIDVGIGALVFLGNGLFFASFNTTRQILAAIIVLFAWGQLNKKKYINVLLLFLLALLIHNTSILFVVFYGIYIFRKRKMLYWIAPVAVVVGAVNYRFILEIAGKIFAKYSYIISNERTYMTLGFSAIVWGIVIALSIIILCHSKVHSMKARLNALLCFIYPVFSALGLFMNYFERLAFYFIPFSAPVFETVGTVELKKYRQLYFPALYTCFIIWFMISSMSYPYSLYR